MSCRMLRSATSVCILSTRSPLESALFCGRRFRSRNRAQHNPTSSSSSSDREKSSVEYVVTEEAVHPSSVAPSNRGYEFTFAQETLSKRASNNLSDAFFDGSAKRCELCGDALTTSFSAHSGHVRHQARLGIVERALTGKMGPVKGMSDRLWGRLTASEEAVAIAKNPQRRRPPQNATNTPDTGMKSRKGSKVPLRTWDQRVCDLPEEELRELTVRNFNRVPSSSAATEHERRWRLRYLLEFLRIRGVLRDSLSATIAKRTSIDEVPVFSRSLRFELTEMIGDNVMKVVIPDRLAVLFPGDEGGVSSRLSQIQQMLDSNDGLLRIYDYLGLDSIIGANLPNSKMKSDVVESIFGELQSFLWAGEITGSCSQYPANPTVEFRHLCALVNHVLNELTHVIVHWCVDSTLQASSAFLEKNITDSYDVKKKVSSKENEWASHCALADRHKYDCVPVLAPFGISPPQSLVAASTGFHAEHGGTRKGSGGGSNRHGDDPNAGIPKEELERKKRKFASNAGPLELLTESTPRPAVLTEVYRAKVRAVCDEMAYAQSASDAAARVSDAASENGGEQSVSKSLATGFLQRYPSWQNDEEIGVAYQSVEKELSPMYAPIEWNALLQSCARIVPATQAAAAEADNVSSPSHPDFSETQSNAMNKSTCTDVQWTLAKEFHSPHQKYYSLI